MGVRHGSKQPKNKSPQIPTSVEIESSTDPEPSALRDLTRFRPLPLAYKLSAWSLGFDVCVLAPRGITSLAPAAAPIFALTPNPQRG